MDKFDEKVIGYESIKNILRQILDNLKRPELYKSKGASIPRGLKNCASVHQEIINTEPYDSVFGSRHNYTAISVRNNYGLDNIGDPTSYVKSSDVKLKEIDANGNKIGSSLSVN